MTNRIKVIDLGADFRLNDKAEYQQWYKLEHTQDDLLSSAIYGLCEINREQKDGNILSARCPTSERELMAITSAFGWLCNKRNNSTPV
jgi:hypothetical protein